jgi:hypothetical protein
MNKHQLIKKNIELFISAKNQLKELDVLRSERITGEFGEWFAEELTGAKRAKSTTQKGWDLLLNEKKYQVKTHAKGEKNNARWTDWKYSKRDFDVLVVLIFSSSLSLREAYIIPFEDAYSRVNKNNKQVVLKWDNYPEFRVTKFPEHLQIFLDEK